MLRVSARAGSAQDELDPASGPIGRSRRSASWTAASSIPCLFADEAANRCRSPERTAAVSISTLDRFFGSKRIGSTMPITGSENTEPRKRSLTRATTRHERLSTQESQSGSSAVLGTATAVPSGDVQIAGNAYVSDVRDRRAQESRNRRSAGSPSKAEPSRRDRFCPICAAS
jgi:hypothetical protein